SSIGRAWPIGTAGSRAAVIRQVLDAAYLKAVLSTRARRTGAGCAPGVCASGRLSAHLHFMSHMVAELIGVAGQRVHRSALRISKRVVVVTCIAQATADCGIATCIGRSAALRASIGSGVILRSRCAGRLGAWITLRIHRTRRLRVTLARRAAGGCVLGSA